MRVKGIAAALALAFTLAAGTALAGVGNGTSDVPPGLVNARAKVLAAIERRMLKEEQQFAKKLARLDAQLQEALLLGDLEAAAEIQEQIDATTAKYDARMARLQAKYAEKDLKFQQLMDEFLLRRQAQEPDDPEDGTEPPQEG